MGLKCGVSGATLGFMASVCWIRMSAEAISADCRTKLVGSANRGSIRPSASWTDRQTDRQT